MDGSFYVGSFWIQDGRLQMYAVQIDESRNDIGTIDSFPGAGIVSRKAQIRGTGPHSGASDPFNGCNLVYSSATGLAANGTFAPPPVSANNHCVVK